MKYRYVFAFLGAVSVCGAASAIATMVPIAETTTNDHPIEIRQRHTLRDFHELPAGISYDDASRTLGHIGHEILRSAQGDIPSIERGVDAFEWPNPNGSRMVLIFRNDRMILKLQTELR
jgi:hypothetical protein